MSNIIRFPVSAHEYARLAQVRSSRRESFVKKIGGAVGGLRHKATGKLCSEERRRNFAEGLFDAIERDIRTRRR